MYGIGQHIPSMSDADKQWEEICRIGERLSITAEDIAPFLRFSQRSGHVTLTEDLSVRVAKGNL